MQRVSDVCFEYRVGAYVPQFKIKRQVCLSIYRIQRIGFLLDDVRGHIPL